MTHDRINDVLLIRPFYVVREGRLPQDGLLQVSYPESTSPQLGLDLGQRSPFSGRMLTMFGPCARCGIPSDLRQCAGSNFLSNFV